MNRSWTPTLETPPAPIKRRPSFHHLRFQAAELDLTFKLAETRDEREQAFQVLHDMYVRRGLIDPASTCLRLNVFSVLPTTAIFIGIRDGRVLSTMSLIEDSLFGLPMDEVYREEIEGLRRRRRRLAEVGALAVVRGARGKGLNMMMYNLMFRWAHFYRRIDDLLITVRASIADFYATVLLFERLGGRRIYAALKDVPAAALRLDMHAAIARYRSFYDPDGDGTDGGPARNLYRFFVCDEYPSLSLPPRPTALRLATPPAWNPADVRELLSNQGVRLEDFSAEQRRFVFPP